MTQISHGSYSRHSLLLREAVLEIALSLGNTAGTSCQQTGVTLSQALPKLDEPHCTISAAGPLEAAGTQSFKSVNKAILCILITFPSIV